MDNKELYFIALIPDNDLKKRVREVKERIRSDYGAGHALKSPAHITLQMPFKREQSDETAISAVLRRFAREETSFNIEVNGFGAFPPRVIYIRITDPDPVISLHRRLKETLMDQLGFSEDEIMKHVQPHITVATRDLSREAFSEAWPEFMNEEFPGRFEVKSIFLLKHNGRNWDVCEEYPMGIK